MLQTFSMYAIRGAYLLNKDFIARVLCINKEKPKMQCEGKCYLSKKLKEQEQQDQQAPHLKKEKYEVQPCHIEQVCYLEPIAALVTNHYNTDSVSCFTRYPSEVFHPPAV